MYKLKCQSVLSAGKFDTDFKQSDCQHVSLSLLFHFGSAVVLSDFCPIMWPIILTDSFITAVFMNTWTTLRLTSRSLSDTCHVNEGSLSEMKLAPGGRLAAGDILTNTAAAFMKAAMTHYRVSVPPWFQTEEQLKKRCTQVKHHP